jgi:hypothetical protein
MNFVWKYGVIESIDDPDKLGRVQVRVFGDHTDELIAIPTEDLPWAKVLMPPTSASVNGIGETHGLLNSSWVMIFYEDGEAMERPVVMGSFLGITNQLPDTSKGFNDPDGVYPKADHQGEPDVNRLARNDNIEETIKQTKDDSQVTGVAIAGGGSFDEPLSPYAAEYPNNKVTEYEGGHVEEIDNTPGAERLHKYHKSGTYEEIGPNGEKVVKVVTDAYTIILGSSYASIDGDCNITATGNINLKASAVKIDAGDIELSAGASTITGTNITIDASGILTLKGTSIVKQAH